MSKKIIYVLVPPGTGHINPLCGLVYEICKNPNIECYFYGNVEYKSVIEKTGAKFRLYSNRNYANAEVHDTTDKNFNRTASMAGFMNIMIDSAYDLVPQLLKDYDADKPHLIIYDKLLVPVSYLFNLLQKRRNEKLPQIIEFYPNFVLSKAIMDLYPEINIMEKSLNTLIHFGGCFMHQFKVSRALGLSIYNPLNLMMGKTEYTKLVAVFPELHPLVEQYDDSYKFIGTCASEEARPFDWNSDPQMKSFLDAFLPKDETKRENETTKLILISLGTVFHIPSIFEVLIRSLIEFDRKPSRQLKLSQLKVIMSVGEKGLKALTEKIDKGELKVPENILLRPKVPQLEVLKRADLFVTHCGMNSTSETIKYGVPIIGIPLDADQPIIARRVCDELSLGVRLDAHNLNVNVIGDAIEKVLTGEKYARKMSELSRTSAKYNGVADGTKIIMKMLNQ